MDRPQLKLALHKVRGRSGRSYTAAPAVCQPVGTASSSDVEVEFGNECDIAIAQYRHERAVDGDGAPRVDIAPGFTQDDFERDMRSEGWYDPQYALTWEEEREVKEPEMDQRIDKVKAPGVVARGTVDRSKYKCWCCGERAAHDLQMPSDVFGVAYTKDGPAGAIRALKEFSRALVSGDYEEAIKRTACCRQLECMVAQGKLTPENYETWRFSVTKNKKTGEETRARNQLERGTERMDQGVIFSDNILLLRWIFLLKDKDGACVLSKEEIRALFHWVVLNSRFVQEREMRYIATAMAIVGSSSFPFTFVDEQSFVDKMSGVPRTYCFKRLLEHIFDTKRDPYHWKSWGNRLLETAFPKAADTAYLLVCRENWIAQGRPRKDGRPHHRVSPDNKELQKLFTGAGFRRALQQATKENPMYKLYYASHSGISKKDVKGARATSRDETRALLKAISGSHRSGPMKAKGVKGKKCAPTDGARQADSSVHTEQRYDGACEGIGLDEHEKEATLSLMIDKHKKGNSVGKEKLQGVNADKTKSKACAVLRPVELYTPPVVQRIETKRTLAERMFKGASFVAVKQAKVRD